MTDGRSLPDGRLLPSTGAAPTRGPGARLSRPAGYGLVLATLALSLLVALWVLPVRAASYALWTSGSLGALTLAALVRGECRRAHANRPHSAGRIVETRQAQGHVLFVLPALSLEPWRADTWVLWIFSLCSGWVGSSLIGRAGGYLQVVVLGLLAVRALGAARGVFRIELEPGRWLVEAVVGKRVLRRVGHGALMPELTPEALSLWSDAGRVAVLRWELEANERQWLSERLTHYLETESLGAIAQEADEVDRSEAEQHG